MLAKEWTVKIGNKVFEVESVTLPSLADKTKHRLVEIHSQEEAIKYGKHCGWCTGKTDNNYYQTHYQHGRLFVIYKPKKRRLSYQLFIGSGRLAGGLEFKRKGQSLSDDNINPWKFARDTPDITEELLSLLPEEKQVVKQRQIGITDTNQIMEQFAQLTGQDLGRLVDEQIQEILGGDRHHEEAIMGWMSRLGDLETVISDDNQVTYLSTPSTTAEHKQSDIQRLQNSHREKQERKQELAERLNFNFIN